MATQGQVSPDELQQFYDTTEQASLVPGWLGSAPRVPKSFVVSTSPVPKYCAQMRLTVTRAVSGWSPDTSH